jgi:hypothetical protein
MRNRSGQIWRIAPLLVLLFILTGQQALAGPLPGAIFTTLEDGTRVNANIYENMEDVYLDGGPGNNAPASAAGLPEGDYYFQVTDPSGKVLLSEDAVKCRRIHVGPDGFITAVVPATALVKVRGKFVEEACTHNTGIDADHGDVGAITVQLMPYARTPNKGGVYKVWITPVERFVGDPEQVDNPDYFHGFIPAWSKTDNYKVRRGGRNCDPTLTILKFDDSDANGVWDAGEQGITGWGMLVTDPLATPTLHFTQVLVPLAVPAGVWTVQEETRDGWLQTALIIDGVPQVVSDTAGVLFVGDCLEHHEIIFGNIELGDITACKFYDRNGDGNADEGEPPVEGILFVLDGNNIQGTTVHMEAYSGADGCVTFADLLPGEYMVCEILPPGWVATTDTCASVSLAEGANVDLAFGNYCEGQADFSTKGYWHNKNGITELQSNASLYASVLAYVNSRDPYNDPSGYFSKGDEPFDGVHADGSDVPAGKGVLENEDIADAGTKEAEISNFLIDSVGDGGQREQLAQQLLAFIFNIYYRIGDDLQTVIILGGGESASAADLIDCAVQAWSSPTGECNTTVMVPLLDALNNSDAVSFIRFTPCEVIYP